MSIAKNGLFGVLSALILSSADVNARQSFLDEWRTIYPDSSSSRRGCQLCHARSEGGQPWNGYGFDIRTRFIEINRFDIRTAIVDAQAINSDGDVNGMSNLQEIEQGFDPGWRAPGFNFILYADMNFDQVLSPFNDTDNRDVDFCFVIPLVETNKAVTVCL